MAASGMRNSRFRSGPPGLEVSVRHLNAIRDTVPHSVPHPTVAEPILSDVSSPDRPQASLGETSEETSARRGRSPSGELCSTYVPESSGNGPGRPARTIASRKSRA
jgi:hypothetical protein